jgi:hypothetical protein
MPALGSAGIDNRPPALGFHAHTKAMCALAARNRRLISAFHKLSFLLFCAPPSSSSVIAEIYLKKPYIRPKPYRFCQGKLLSRLELA